MAQTKISAFHWWSFLYLTPKFVEFSFHPTDNWFFRGLFSTYQSGKSQKTHRQKRVKSVNIFMDRCFYQLIINKNTKKIGALLVVMISIHASNHHKRNEFIFHQILPSTKNTKSYFTTFIRSKEFIIPSSLAIFVSPFFVFFWNLLSFLTRTLGPRKGHQP